MTREDIEQLNVVEPYCFESDREEQWYNIGLKHGLEIADENPNLASLWRNVSEEPKIGSNIVAIDRNAQWWVIQPYDDDYKGCRLKGWESCVHNYNDIQKWAYISDLLPKE